MGSVYFTSNEKAPGIDGRYGRGAASHEGVKYDVAGITGYLYEPFQTFDVFHGRVFEAMLYSPCRIIGRLWVLTSKPAAIKARFVLLNGISVTAAWLPRRFCVPQQFGFAENTAAFVAEDNPFTVVCVTTLQITGVSSLPFFYHQTVFDCKACLYKALVMKRVFVVPRKKIGMGIILQYPIALLRKHRIIYPRITSQKGQLFPCKLVLISDSIWRVGEDKLDKVVGKLLHQVKGVHVVDCV